MSKPAFDIDDLIGKYLAGEASAEERRLVEVWCKTSSENQQYYEHLKLIFDKASESIDVGHYDADKAWFILKTKLSSQKSRQFNFSFVRIAASILLISVIGFWAYQSFVGFNTTTQLASSTSIIQDILPDGTQVVLNKQSELSIAYNEKKKKGRIQLKGEASFAIKHEKDKELIVEAAEVFIRDIGTVFNVRAYEQSNTVEVSVTEGEVQFYTANNQGIFIKAGGKGIYNKLSKEFSLEAADTNIMAYANRQFVFEETDLQTVVEQLNAIYEKKISISENLKSCRLTVNFENEDIDTIAEIIAETLNLKVIGGEQNITLEGEGCD